MINQSDLDKDWSSLQFPPQGKVVTPKVKYNVRGGETPEIITGGVRVSWPLLGPLHGGIYQLMVSRTRERERLTPSSGGNWADNSSADTERIQSRLMSIC